MPAAYLSLRPLGSSGMDVSALSLGSWRTFESLPAETGIAIMRAARDEGINFFDDARYNDETGKAPIPTGYSEVLFGERGVLTGKYRSAPAAGRVAGMLGEPRFAPAVAAADQLAGMAARLDTAAAALALAFPLTNPAVTSVLFGATSVRQLRANCAAVGLIDRLRPEDVAALLRVGLPPALADA
jgi:aryl-alcohol dehydrogenase-like predicted oxidoreductase